MKKPIPGIQLYSLMRHIQTPEDYDATLAKLAAMGVKDIQISGIGDFSVEIQKKTADKYGMAVCVTHQGLERFLGEPDTLIEEHRLLECDAIGLGCPPEEYRAPFETAEKLVHDLNDVGAKLNAAGMSFHYHNHNFEFAPIGDSGVCLMDLLLQAENINFVPDVAWMHYAGVDPARMLRKMKGRVKVIHFKDYITDENGNIHFVSLGQGKVDLKECYKAACELEIPYIVYEQDSGWVNDDAFLAAKQSWDYMNSLERSAI